MLKEYWNINKKTVINASLIQMGIFLLVYVILTVIDKNPFNELWHISIVTVPIVYNLLIFYKSYKQNNKRKKYTEETIMKSFEAFGFDYFWNREKEKTDLAELVLKNEKGDIIIPKSEINFEWIVAERLTDVESYLEETKVPFTLYEDKAKIILPSYEVILEYYKKQ